MFGFYKAKVTFFHFTRYCSLVGLRVVTWLVSWSAMKKSTSAT